jgi:hypothetical protein
MYTLYPSHRPQPCVSLPFSMYFIFVSLTQFTPPPPSYTPSTLYILLYERYASIIFVSLLVSPNEAEGYRGLAQHGGLPGWLEESDPAGCDFVHDGGFMRPALTDFWQIQLLLLMCYYGMYTKHRHELYYAKAWVYLTLVKMALWAPGCRMA